MKVWEARKADGLDYDPEDPKQQVSSRKSPNTISRASNENPHHTCGSCASPSAAGITCRRTASPQADIAGAEQRHIVPVVGRALYNSSKAPTPDSATDTSRPRRPSSPVSPSIAARHQHRGDAATAPRPPAASRPRRRSEALRRSLRTQARTLLRRAGREHLFAHRDEFPEPSEKRHAQTLHDRWRLCSDSLAARGGIAALFAPIGPLMPTVVFIA